jgi:N-acetylglucosaminyl-diphospho-decaprenol L-rhamnosyltransferase
MSCELTVVFINYNSARLLGRALSSLRQAEPRLDIELLVVDNASDDRQELVTVCRQHRARLLRLGRNVGYGAAFNRGYREARGRYVAVANPDLVFGSPAPSGLVRHMDENPRTGAVSPQLYYADGKAQPSCRRFPRLRYLLAGRRSPLVRLFPRSAPAREFLYSDAHLSPGPLSVEAVIGTFVVFRRAALDAVRGFDEGFFMYAEDLDICRRVRRAGWDVVLEPRLHVTHHYGAVRRQHPEFSDYQRLKALCRFFGLESGTVGRALFSLAFAGYLFLSEAGWLLGLREFEYSWQSQVRSQ